MRPCSRSMFAAVICAWMLEGSAPGVSPGSGVRMKSSGGVAAVRTIASACMATNPGASTMKLKTPIRSPSIAQRPLESEVAIPTRGCSSGFAARIVAPLIGLPSMSRTVPVALAVCADAGTASQKTLITAITMRRRGTMFVLRANILPPVPHPRSLGPDPGPRALIPDPRALIPVLEVIQHEVDDDAGHRHVQPHGQGPARDPDVTRVIAAESARGRHERQRQDCRGQNNVGNQDGKIDRAYGAGAAERDRAGVGVIDDVAD